MSVVFTQNVGVAPGTTTLGRSYWDPYTDMISLSAAAPPRDSFLTDRRIRWDLVVLVGGSSLLIALTAAFVASAFRR